MRAKAAHRVGCAMSEIVLYHSVASRAFVALWMLEELGVPFRIEDTDIRSRKHKAPAYLKLNPMGKVPALDDGGAIVTETPAICLYLLRQIRLRHAGAQDRGSGACGLSEVDGVFDIGVSSPRSGCRRA